MAAIDSNTSYFYFSLNWKLLKDVITRCDPDVYRQQICPSFLLYTAAFLSHLNFFIFRPIAWRIDVFLRRKPPDYWQINVASRSHDFLSSDKMFNGSSSPSLPLPHDIFSGAVEFIFLRFVEGAAKKRGMKYESRRRKIPARRGETQRTRGRWVIKRIKSRKGRKITRKFPGGICNRQSGLLHANKTVSVLT